MGCLQVHSEFFCFFSFGNETKQISVGYCAKSKYFQVLVIENNRISDKINGVEISS